jgi:hypothetical protein
MASSTRTEVFGVDRHTVWCFASEGSEGKEGTETRTGNFNRVCMRIQPKDADIYRVPSAVHVNGVSWVPVQA